MLGIIHGMLGAVSSGLGQQGGRVGGRGGAQGKTRQAGEQRVLVHSTVSRLAVCSVCKTGQTKLLWINISIFVQHSANTGGHLCLGQLKGPQGLANAAQLGC